jgi:hypothetical protein
MRQIKSLTIFVLLIFNVNSLFSQPGNLDFFCFSLFDSFGEEINPIVIENKFHVSFCSIYDMDSCFGMSYCKEKDSIQYSCIMTTAGNNHSSERFIRMVNADNDTLRLYYTYKTFDAENSTLILNPVMFKPGNYIIKKPVDRDDWQHYKIRPFRIKKIKGNKQLFIKKVLKTSKTFQE